MISSGLVIGVLQSKDIYIFLRSHGASKFIWSWLSIVLVCIFPTNCQKIWLFFIIISDYFYAIISP